jgi:subtilisin family serine protease
MEIGRDCGDLDYPESDTDVLIEFVSEVPDLATLEALNLSVLRTYSEIITVKVRSTLGIPADELADELEDLEGVVFAKPDRGIGVPEAFGMSISFDDGGGDPHFEYVHQDFLQSLRVGAAHLASRGAGVRIALIDTGVDPTHPDLAGHLGAGWDFVDDDSDPTDIENGVDDDGDGHVDEAFGHGTHLGGLLALLAPDAEIVPYRVLDADGVGSASNVAGAVLRAVADGVDVINLSLGMKNPYRPLRLAVEHAAENGVIVVASIGNDGQAAPHFPAAYSEAIAIGSADPTDALSSFSNYGVTLHCVAPGEEILSLYPDERYAVWTGTSMSTPMAASLAAVLLAHPAAPSVEDVTELLESTGVLLTDVPVSGTIHRLDFWGAVTRMEGARTELPAGF